MLQDVRCRDEDTNVGPALLEFLDWSLSDFKNINKYLLNSYCVPNTKEV